MGVDLTVVMNVNTGLSEKIIRLKPELGLFFSNELVFQRDSDLFEKISHLDLKDVDFKVTRNDEVITEDPYGDPLQYVLAEEFQKIQICVDYSDWNANILCFLQNLKEDTVVVLYWH